MNYRELFYKHYLSKNPQKFKQYTSSSFESLIPMFERYFGRFLPKDKAAKIVDIACGSGSFVWWLQRKGFRNTSGIDISPETIQLGKLNIVDNLMEADFRKVLAMKHEEHDLIAAHDVLEHFSKDEVIEILRLIHSSLRPGGTFLLSVPNAASPFGACVRYADFTHELSFTPDSLTNLLLVCDFENIEIYPKEPVVHGCKSILRWLFWKVIETFLKFYCLVERGTIGEGIFTRVMYAVCKKAK